MRLIKKGATSQSIYFVVLDSTSTTGGRKTGLAYNTSSLTAYYVRNGGSAVSITLATLAAANSAWSSGGFKEIDATNMPGVYRLDVPDAAVASGVDSVVITLKGATGMVQVDIEIQVTGSDLQDSVRAGLTALPNATANAIGGLPVGIDPTGDFTSSAVAVAAGLTNSGTQALKGGIIQSGSFTAGAINNAAIATDAIGAAELAADAVTEIANGLLDLTDGVESGETLRQCLRLLRAVVYGISDATDPDAGTIVFKRKDGSTTALTVVYTTQADRTTVTVGTV